MGAVLVASWLLLWKWHAVWVSFGLLILVPIVVPVGFVIVVGQAGMLLDVRTLKVLYPRVIAGFALGYVAGGVVGPPLLSALGRTEHLLAAGAFVVAAFLALVSFTHRSYPAELALVQHDAAVDGIRPTLRSLLSNRFVVLIMAYQMLSAIESQWLDFLVFDRAGRRYQDSQELAQFVGRFSAITYGTDIIFLLIVAGFALRRFGLRYGLIANPAAVMTLIGALLAAAMLRGSGTSAVFVLIVATRVSDLVLSDGATRTSVSAAYQAVSPTQRLAAQAAVEGIAVPVAIGFSGLALIVIRATVGTDGIALPLITAFVLLVWMATALLVYRGYRENLLHSLRHRTLDPETLTLGGIESIPMLAAIDRLLESSTESDVRLGLDVLESAEHPSLAVKLQRLLSSGSGPARAEAVTRLVHVDRSVAAEAARRSVGDPDPLVRAAGLRALGSTGSPSDTDGVASLVDDPDNEVRFEALVALLRIGDVAARYDIATHVATMAGSPRADERVRAARILAASDAGEVDRALLRTLLDDPHYEVVNAALSAFRWPDDAELLAKVAAHLDDRRTAGAAVDTLVRCDTDLLGLIDDGLSGRVPLSRRGQQLLTRLCRDRKDPSAVDVLLRHVDHADREVGLAVMLALDELPDRQSAGPPCANGSVDKGALGSAVVLGEVEHAADICRALLVFEGTSDATAPLTMALHDELALVRRRVLAGLSLRYGRDRIDRVTFQLAQRSPRAHALALEWLEVTLAPSDRSAVSLLDPGLQAAARNRQLARRFTLPALPPAALLRDFIDDSELRWRRPWLTACALVALHEFSEQHFEELAAREFGRNGEGEGDIVQETVHGLRQRESIQRPYRSPN